MILTIVRVCSSSTFASPPQPPPAPAVIVTAAVVVVVAVAVIVLCLIACRFLFCIMTSSTWGSPALQISLWVLRIRFAGLVHDRFHPHSLPLAP